MPLSFQQHTANGSTTVFDASQIDGYLSVSDIYVFVNDVQKTAGVHYTLQTSPSLQITFTSGNTPANGSEVRIQRITPNTVAGRAVDFADGSVLNANDLDQSALQLLYITQEAEDTGSGALGKQFDQLSWNAESLPITNLTASGTADSAATKGYVDNLALYGGAVTVPQAWTFSGDSSQDTFTLNPVASSTDPAMFIVEVDGVLLRPTTDYTIPATSQILFATAPSTASNNIRVRNLGVARNVNESVSTAMIQNNAVTAAKIDSNAVTTAKIDAGAVTSAKLDSSLAITTGLTVGGQVVGPKGANTNSVLGLNAGSAISSGANNVVIGNGAGAGVTTGNINTLVGAGANTSSGTSDAVAVGRNARAGSACVAVGNYALLAGASTVDNVAVGHAAVTSCTGASNVAVGAYSGAALTNGIQNVLIGRSANVQAAGDNNSIVIGYNATGAGSNTTTIGNLSTTRTIIPAGTLEVAGGMAQSLVNSSAPTAASGTTTTIAGIPTWARRVVLTMVDISTNATSPGNSQLLIRVGNGSLKTTDYFSAAIRPGVVTGTSNAGFIVGGPSDFSNTILHDGTFTLTKMEGNNRWVGSGMIVQISTGQTYFFNGHVDVGNIDRIGITTVSGTQAFDSGTFQVHWE